MTDVAISVEHVSKRFKLYHNLITGPIKEHLFFWKAHQYYQEFMAVRDVSLEVKRGEVVGIIGPNGAGKTTLLKMVAGLLPVESGRIRVKGKITALLALGVGVHYEFTGRENIFYGGMLLGMSKREVLRKMEAIIEFAELAKFIDHPYRTYSSGMRTRLLFSISMSIDPDILIVDEALATGDSQFVNKCMGRIREICRGGATILFVSHNLYQIQQLCNRALFLSEGRVMAEGSPAEAITAYNRWEFEEERKSVPSRNNGDTRTHRGTSSTRVFRRGPVFINRVEILDQDGRDTSIFRTWDPMIVRVWYECRGTPPQDTLGLGIAISREEDLSLISRFNTHNVIRDEDLSHYADAPFRRCPGSSGYIQGRFPIQLSEGRYLLSIALLANIPGSLDFYEYHHHYYPFSILRSGFPMADTVYYPMVEWQHCPGQESEC
jgi:ABC-type polysaccharide/polyol phosphate transport system ATPase subunit